MLNRASTPHRSSVVLILCVSLALAALPATIPAPALAQPTPTPTPTPRVTEVTVRGLERVPASVVLDSIGVRVGELLSQERLRADAAAIVATGWFADANVRLEPFRDGVRVVFLVLENPVIAQVTVEGNTVIRTPDVLQALDVPVGQVLNVIRLRDGARAIEKLYEERGFVLARVADISITGNGDARLHLVITEGRIEAVEYKGLVKTRRYVVERGAVVRPGQLFNVNELNRDLQRIFNLELFENIQARPRPGSRPDLVVIEIEVKELRTQQARIGLGYSDRTGIVGLIEYSERNWRGRHQTLTVRFERGMGERNLPSLTGPGATNYLLTFRDPWIDGRRTSMDISLYQTTTTDAEYTGGIVTSRFNLDRLGSSIVFARPLDLHTTASFRLRSERALIAAQPLDPSKPPCDTAPDDPACARPLPTTFTPGRTIALSLGGVRDTRDHRLAPTRGDRISLSTDLGIGALGGDFGFGKYALDYSRYFSLGPAVVVSRLSLGASHGTLPLQEQFSLGGPASLRAFPVGRFRSTSQALVNLEVRMPLGGLIRQLQEFTGVAYVDVGSAPISTNVSLGYGVAVSVSTAVGPIRIDYAFGPEGRQTWLTIGHPF